MKLSWRGLAGLMSSCGVACLAGVVSVWLWPLAVVAAVWGAWELVRPRGCETVPGAGSGAAAALEDGARTLRFRIGGAISALAVLLGLVAWCDFAWLWPLAGVAAWFGASFLVAGATRYAGCPELGAIPSLFLKPWRGKSIETTCRPLESLDERPPEPSVSTPTRRMSSRSRVTSS